MVFDYYPGCTLKNKASRLDNGARRVAEYLGVELREIPFWQCCGGVYPLSENETAQKLPAVRTLMYSKENSGELLTVCSACHHLIKYVYHDMKNNLNIRTKANTYLENDEWYCGETKVVHYLEMLRDSVGFEELKKRINNPLKGRKIAPYYGCLLVRPSKVMNTDNNIMENFINALGAESVVYPFKSECCGGYMAAEDKNLTEKKCKDIIGSAASHGADMIITACPLCMYNLKKYSDIPVKYFTEPLCEALGIEVDGND